MRDYVALARVLATAAHSGQTDGAGVPYLTHPARVAARFTGEPVLEAAAWLHDAVEDSALTLRDLRDAGLPERVVELVGRLTKPDGADYQKYVAGLRDDPDAVRLKRADLADNSDPQRNAFLARTQPERAARLRKKYATAKRTLAE